MRKSVEAQRSEALASVRDGRLQEAMTAYEVICSDVGCTADDWFMLGIVSGKLGDFARSASACMSATSRNPCHSAAYFAAGMAFHALGDLQAAAREFSTAIRLDPSNQEAIRRYRSIKYAINRKNRLFVKMKGNISVCLPATLDCLTTYVLLEKEDWFEPEIEFIRKLLRGGECVLDIGANYGTYTSTIAQAVGETGCVYAYEPAAETASFLAESLRINDFDNVIMERIALSNRSGKALLHTGIIAECNTLAAGGEGTGTESVEVSTLDEVASTLDCSAVSFVKIDVEGEEENLLQGGREFLAENSPLIMMEIRHGDKVNLHLVELLEAVGYLAYHYVPGLNVLVPFSGAKDADSLQLNLFFCKQDRMEELACRELLLRSSDVVEAGRLPGLFGDEYREYMGRLECYSSSGYPHLSVQENPFPGWQVYLEGMSYYAISRSDSFRVAARYRALLAADRKIASAVNVHSTNARTLSLARVRADLGKRASAATLLESIIVNGGVCIDDVNSEPFIPASTRYEKLPAGNDIRQWLESSISETYELLRGFTSFAHGVDILERLGELKASAYSGPEIERRYQLKRLQCGLQDSPAFNEKVLDDTGVCLNTEFWKTCDAI